MRPPSRAIFLVLVQAVAITWIAIAPAQAHRPYFKQARPILLPDGTMGEMRVIAGDGIVVADPVRIVILNGKNRLIARGPRVRWLSLICEASLRCYGYDHESSNIIVPDPTSFEKDGPVVPSADERDDLWEIEGGEAQWGVTVRPATWGEWIVAEGEGFLATSPMTLALYAILGMVAGLCFVGLQAPGRTGMQFLLWLGGMALRVALCVAVTLVLLVAAVMGDTLPNVMLIAVLAGLFLAALLGSKIRRWFRSALAAR